MALTLDQILAMINSVFWPFVRIGAMFAAAPILGARSLPVQYRASSAAHCLDDHANYSSFTWNSSVLG